MRWSRLHATGGVEISGRGDIAEVDLGVLADAFHEAELVLLTGFEVDLARFDSLSMKLSPGLVEHPNVLREPYKDRTLTSASPGKDHFFAHAELGYLPIQPDVAWFYCHTPARTGGETVVYDGVELLTQLSPQTRRLLSSRGIVFESRFGPEAWRILASDREAFSRRFAPFVEEGVSYYFDAEDNLLLNYPRAAITPTRNGNAEAFCNSLLDIEEPRFEDGDLVPKEVLREVIGASEDIARPVRWRAGDVLLFDNHRFMHGRRAFDDSERKIFVRFANLRKTEL